MIDRRPDAPAAAAGPGRARRRSHPARYVVVVGCERMGRLVRYGLPGTTKPPNIASGDFPCPCGQTHRADALSRQRRRGERVEVELEDPPRWHKRRTIVREGE